MKELSLHILDIAENSIGAKADFVRIAVDETVKEGYISIEIQDNGPGIQKEMIGSVADPFVTTRTERRIGMGISLFKAAAEQSCGAFDIESDEKKGTRVKAVFKKDHVDTAPVGDTAATIITLLAGNPGLDIRYEHATPENSFFLDTREIRQDLEGIDIDHPAVLEKIKELINDNIGSKR
ncbi:MAG: ATP-binding protein [Desulfarculaceae bacterium]|nr:ATP-binding protein [Desulfarculaceae bacterium]